MAIFVIIVYMKQKFKNILTGIFSTAIGVVGTASETKAIPSFLAREDQDNLKVWEQNKQNDLSKKLVLKPAFAGDSFMIAYHRSHRSHRSHSSHRSHTSHRSSSYSGYSGRTTVPYYPSYVPSYNPSRSSTTTSTVPSTTKTNYTLGERTIKSQMSGKDVAELATLLVTLQYLSNSDFSLDSEGNATYSSVMEKAVKSFQQDVSVKADGMVGPTTVSHLKKEVKKREDEKKSSQLNLGDRILHQGMEGKDVTQLKNILIDKGFLQGKFVKGVSKFDADLKQAVIKFQKTLEIDSDGVVDAQTVYFLKK